MILKEAAVEFMVREDRQALVHVAKRLHDAALHQQACPADWGVKLQQILEPSFVRAVVRAEHGLLPQRPRAHLALAWKAPDAIDAWMLVHVLHLVIKLAWRDDFIRCEQAEVLAFRFLHGDVDALRDSYVLIEPDEPDAAVVELCDDCLQVFGRSVIDYNQFPILERLPGDTLDHRFEADGVVENLRAD